MYSKFTIGSLGILFILIIVVIFFHTYHTVPRSVHENTPVPYTSSGFG